MSDALKTRNVFIDTSIFVSSNFAVDTGAFATLISLCQTESVRLLLTDITLKEVDAKLSDAVNAAQTAINKLRSEARVLRNLRASEFRGLFAEFDREKCLEALRQNINGFLELTGAEI